jgi:hypothetical protein
MQYSPQGKGRLARPWGEQSTRSSVEVTALEKPYSNHGPP